MNEEKRIIKAARKMFFSYGYSKITMDELATHLHMSKNTIYKKFPSKKYLLKEVIDDFFKEISTDLDQIILHKDLSFKEMFERYTYFLYENLSKLNVRAVNDIKKTNPDLWMLINDYREDILKTKLKEIIQKGMNEGVIKRELSLEIIMEIIINSVQKIVVPEFVSELPLSFEQVLDMIMDIILEGVLTNN